MYVIQTFISLFPLPYLQTLFSLSSLIVENNRDYKINKSIDLFDVFITDWY